jgi:hypothetical protein
MQRDAHFFFMSIGSQSMTLLVGLFRRVVGSQILAAKSPREYEVKAVFIFNISRFVSWPEQVLPPEKQTSVIGVRGFDPFDQ